MGCSITAPSIICGASVYRRRAAARRGAQPPVRSCAGVSNPFAYGIAAAEDAGPETLYALESKAETLAQALGAASPGNLKPRHGDYLPRQELYVTFRGDPALVEANLFAIPRKQRHGA